ncbi:hypothetical protein QR680_004096 [Steinernema hermaphroditum]|uniref:Uncharacterized protein n=1 Tax=Steinernema hermaphroditum TaxID=289476 RepID=A0AA39HMM7_9BILA|nr:hypothetical protein QR680_004096 [Steinernema hermaphroditum]
MSSSDDKCLCGLVDVKKGTLIFGAMMFISGACGVLNSVADVGSTGLLAAAFSILLNVGSAAVGGVTIYAIKHEQHKLVKPFIIWQYALLVLLALAAAGTIILQLFPKVVADFADMTKKGEEVDTSSIRISLIMFTVFLALGALWPWWALGVAKRAHKLIKEGNSAPATEMNTQKA